MTVAARKDLYGDAFNESLLMRPGQWLTRLSVVLRQPRRRRPGQYRGRHLSAASSGRLRKVQTGFVRSYALSMFVGAVLLLGALLLVRL